MKPPLKFTYCFQRSLEMPFTVQSGSRLDEMYIPYWILSQKVNWFVRTLDHPKMTENSHTITL